MTNIVEFPGLGWSFEVSRVAFTVFGVAIYWYGVLIGLGVVLAIGFAFTQAKRFGIDADRMIDVIMIGIVCAIIGGRLYYVLFTDEKYANFIDLINLRNGGIAFYGAAIGAFIGAGIACKVRKVPIRPLFDLAGMGFLIGQTLGRWGNFFNQEAFGRNTTLPWGMISPETTNYLLIHQERLLAEGTAVNPLAPVHPTFLYESLWCLLGFLLLLLYKNRRRFNGELFLMYLMWYGFGRTLIESLRTDSLWISGLGLRVSQVVGITSFMVALVLWVVARVRTAGKPLVVPALPLRTEKIKVDGVAEKVLISWPGEDKEPTKEEKTKMAQAVLEAQKDDAEENDDTPVISKDAERAQAKAEKEADRAHKAEEKAEKLADKAEKAQAKAEKEAEKAQRDIEKAQEKAEKAADKAEKAEDKAGKAAEKAAEKAEQAESTAEKAAEKVEQADKAAVAAQPLETKQDTTQETPLPEKGQGADSTHKEA